MSGEGNHGGSVMRGVMTVLGCLLAVVVCAAPTVARAEGNGPAPQAPPGVPVPAHADATSVPPTEAHITHRYKLLLIQGANLNYLGRREPELYGTTSAAELDAIVRAHAAKHGYDIEIFYTNIEGEAINRLYRAVDEHFDGVVMNPGG